MVHFAALRLLLLKSLAAERLTQGKFLDPRGGSEGQGFGWKSTRTPNPRTRTPISPEPLTLSHLNPKEELE